MDGISSAAVEVLVQNLIDLIKQEYSLVQGLDEDAKQLQTTLCMIQAYLSDAEKKSIAQDAVKIWLRDLEALAFDADNVLDELSYHHLHKKFKKMKASKNKVLLSCFSSLNTIVRPRNMGLKIKQINMDFDSMNKRASDLGLQSMIVNAPAAAPLASFETDSLTLDPIFIGRDDDVPKLVDMVVESPHEKNLSSILAIVGMGGLGKTTLTKRVFNHEKIKTRFGSLIWVHVSQTFDRILLLKKILSNLTSHTPDGIETQEVVLKKLKEALKDKTYLLVLDDIWNDDAQKWGDFMDSMSAVTSTTGNAIIMSSRKEGVASMVRPLHTHHPSALSTEDCWSIVKAKAFKNGEVPSPGFELIGREIAERCRGLPLAANVVGGLLLGKSEEEWRIIKENRLLDVEGGVRIRKILKLSYDHLASPSLKKCFAYCSIFPKGHQIQKQVLIEMWMAEGFLGNEEMESVGDKFVNILLHNSLLLVSVRDEYGNVSKCVMHDLVHDVASFVLGSAEGITPLRYTIQVSGDEEAKHLRTLVFEGDISGTDFSKFESLRVLTLIGNKGQKEVPSSARKLIHLRFLDISKTRISKLPEWIGELHHLQTLRAKTFWMRKMPRTLEYLTNLSHLYLQTLGRDKVSNYTLAKFGVQIGKLSGLRKLDQFSVGNEKGHQIEELGSLNNLKGRLRIENLEKVGSREVAEKANMSLKPKLLDLTLQWSHAREAGETTDNDERVLEGLQPHPNLNRLQIIGYKGNKFPSWVEKMAVRDGLQQEGSWLPLNKLTEIRLDRCSECEEIPRLDHLPNLKSLYLEGLEKVKVINSSFTKLTSLFINALEGLECLPDWLFYNNPNLSVLNIKKCPKLTELPDGLHALLHLRGLTIRDCPNLKSITGNNNNNENEAWKSQGRWLCIEGCESMTELPRGIVESWSSSLEHLTLMKLSSLDNLPMLIDCLSKSPTALRLTHLIIMGVPKLRGSSTSIESGWDLGSLRWLEISVDCGEKLSSGGIKETVDGIVRGCSSNSLKHLELQGMEEWESIPESIQHLTALYDLSLENFGMEELPEWLGNLSSLRFLCLSGCKKLRRLPPAGNAPARLQSLGIKECPQLEIDSEWINIPDLGINLR